MSLDVYTRIMPNRPVKPSPTPIPKKQSPVRDPNAPDDRGITLDVLRYLATPPGMDLLRAMVATLPPGGILTPADAARWRRDLSLETFHAALIVAQTDAKARRSKGKFADSPRWIWGVPEALEQATALPVGRYKAERIGSVCGNARVIDLCCGMGGDALAFAARFPVTAVDRSPVRAWMAEQNLSGSTHPATAIAADIAGLPMAVDEHSIIHIDPARRAAGRRSAAWEESIPGPNLVMPLIERAAGGSIKLSPGVEFDDLPPGHLELISERRAVVQAVLWTGCFVAPFGGAGYRSATVIDGNGQASRLTGQPAASLGSAAPAGRYVLEVDGAVHRAGLAPLLLDRLAAAALSDDCGLLTCDTDPQSPFVTLFETVATFPYAERRLAAHLPPGVIEFKPRGVTLDTDRLQRHYSTGGPDVYSLLIYPAGGTLHATLCRRQLSASSETRP
jgi:hypothetical protein